MHSYFLKCKTKAENKDPKVSKTKTKKIILLQKGVMAKNIDLSKNKIPTDC